MKKKSVSLVLGSGGARGLAHIGVIKWLEENNYEIKSIAGCSIGSLVGGVYAAGKLNQLEEWMLSINNVDMVTLLDLSWGSSGGLIKGEKIINTLVNLIEDIKIEDLSIPSAQDWGMYEVANRASDSMQSTIARLKIAAYPPDVEISIAKNACGTFEFDRAEEMIKLGYEKAQLALNLVSEK